MAGRKRTHHEVVYRFTFSIDDTKHTHAHTSHQIIADIFDTDVYILKGTANSASLGCAYRAKHGARGCGTTTEIVTHLVKKVLASNPAIPAFFASEKSWDVWVRG